MSKGEAESGNSETTPDDVDSQEPETQIPDDLYENESEGIDALVAEIKRLRREKQELRDDLDNLEEEYWDFVEETRGKVAKNTKDIRENEQRHEELREVGVSGDEEADDTPSIEWWSYQTDTRIRDELDPSEYRAVKVWKRWDSISTQVEAGEQIDTDDVKAVLSGVMPDEKTVHPNQVRRCMEKMNELGQGILQLIPADERPGNEGKALIKSMDLREWREAYYEAKADLEAAEIGQRIRDVREESEDLWRATPVDAEDVESSTKG